jgi:transcriptional regulator with XRE-family HTH domain
MNHDGVVGIGSPELKGRYTMGQRLATAIAEREVTQVWLASKCGVTQAAISNLVSDASRKPSALTCIRVCEYLGISPEWLLTGEGEMRANTVITHPFLVEISGLFHKLQQPQKDLLLQTARTLAGKT